jgi:CubicO group peptidase (beta-lactamase class C family)
MRRLCIWLIPILWISPRAAICQDGSGDQAAAFAKIPAAMQAFVDKGEAAGIVCLVSDAEKTLHLSAVGLSEIETKSEMKTDAIFRIASMTKPVTAVALMQLVAQGKLKLDDPVSKHIPSFAKLKFKDGSSPRPVTIKDVMTHTAGVAGSAGWVENQTLEQFCEGIAKQPLAFAPGEKWAYSSGITIGGRLIEIASGEEYAAYLKKHIFAPLEMNDTGFTLAAEQANRVAITYKNSAKPGVLEKVDTPNPTEKRTPSPSGGLYSTAEDMARFYRAVLQDFTASKANLLPADAAKAMLTKQSGDVETGFTPGNAWGIGWCLVQKPQGVTAKLSPGAFGHGGAWGTQGWVDPAKDRIVILMLQRVGLPNSDASEMRAALNELALP